MRLIPGSGAYLMNELDTSLVKNLQPLDAQALTRVRFYAPYVKELSRHRRNKQSNVIWDRLFKLVGTESILTNLEILRISLAIPSMNTVPDPVPFISAFLTPTMVEIDHSRQAHRYMEPYILSHLVSTIAQQSPHLRSLKLSNVAEQTRMGPIHAGQLANSLAQLRNLRILGIGPVALDPQVLAALGSLPYLESLTLSEPYDPLGLFSLERIDKPPYESLPHDSFPSLWHLEINPHFTSDSANQTWNIVSLFQHLTSIYVRINTHVTQAHICGFVRSICQGSPLVTTLRLDYDNNSSGYVSWVSAEIMDSLAQLPLRRLWLVGKGGYYDAPRWDSEQLALALPKLEDLRIRNYLFTFDDLVFMAKHMPRLQQLSLSVHLNNWPSIDELHNLRLSPSLSRLHFNMHIFRNDLYALETSFGLSDNFSKTIAAGLHALWPKGVTCSTRQRSSNDFEILSVDKINKALGCLHKVEHVNKTEIMPQT
ncbi:hypothetical protein RHS02_01237, partial [Rhizoctonia solani]